MSATKEENKMNRRTLWLLLAGVFLISFSLAVGAALALSWVVVAQIAGTETGISSVPYPVNSVDVASTPTGYHTTDLDHTSAFTFTPMFTDYLPAILKSYDVSATETFSVVFLYPSPVGEFGWTYEHERGRQQLESRLGHWAKITYIENVPEGPDATEVIRDLAQQGYKMIFGTSYGYMDPISVAALEFPDVLFEHCSGSKTSSNMSTYFGRMYQPHYLSGIVAGAMTVSDTIGYVASFPIPEVIRGVNAFTLGVRSTNPNAEVWVVWTYSWFDPVKEREAAMALLDNGADIIAQHQDSLAPQEAARERGMLSIGYSSDMRPFVGDTVLTSPMWNWGAYYVQTVQNMLDGIWTTHQYWGSMQDGVVGLADFSPLVPQNVRDLVKTAKQEIFGGQDVFCGPINERGGTVRIPGGECMTDEELLSMDWFVEGVADIVP